MIIRLVQPKQPLFVETPDSMEREEWNTKRLRYSLLSNKRFVRENQNRIPLTQSDRADIILIHLVYVAVTDDSAHWRWTIFCIFLSFSDFHYWIHFATTLFPLFREISVFIMPREKRKNKKIDHNTKKRFSKFIDFLKSAAKLPTVHCCWPYQANENDNIHQIYRHTRYLLNIVLNNVFLSFLSLFDCA